MMKKDMLILGQNAIFSTDSMVTGCNENIIVNGGSGAGKTRFVVEPILLANYNHSLIVPVTKRRIVAEYGLLFKKRGYAVKIIDFSRPENSPVAYEPLMYVKSYADITFLAESIVKANPRKANSTADPYWDDAAVSLLSAEIAYIMETKAQPTFADVLKLHDSLSFAEDGGQIITSLDDKFNHLNEKDSGCFAVSCWRSFKTLPIKTASCVYGALNTTIDSIFSPELRKMLSKSNRVVFEEIADCKTVLFVITSAVNPSLNFLINMFYAQGIKTLFEYAEGFPDGRLPIPVKYIFDDFACGGKINNFPEYISIFREKGISVCLLIQSESQLESMYGSSAATTIINNCDTYVYMGGMDLQSCRSVSIRLNAPIEDVLYMPIGQEFIFRRGQKPIITTRYDVQNDREYQQLQKMHDKKVREEYSMRV